MKRMLSVSLVLTLFGAASLGALPPPSEKTLKGTILCGRCVLKQTKQCNTAIVSIENGRPVTYFFSDRGNQEDYHEEVCGGGRKRGTAIGAVFQKDGKRWITPRKVEYAKD